MLINELFWALFLIVFGACFGWSFRDHLAEKDAQRAHGDHMGMYADPELVHWFRLRSNETDPYWSRMPLREYARKKKLSRMGDTQ